MNHKEDRKKVDMRWGDRFKITGNPEIDYPVYEEAFIIYVENGDHPPREVVDGLKSLLGKPECPKIFTTPGPGIPLYRALGNVSKESLTRILKVDDPPGVGDVSFEGTIKPRSKAGVKSDTIMSFSSDLKFVKRSFFNSIEPNTYSVIFETNTSLNPNTFIDLSAGFYDLEEEIGFFSYEKEFIALSMVKLSRISWEISSAKV